MTQREIKFRGWDEEKKEMRFLTILGLPIPNDLQPLWIHIMQFTGLKDKNGKEIWEGDIIDWDLSQKRKVGISKIAYRLLIGFENGGYFGENKIVGSKHQLFTIDVSRYEIIGNIYENPELLTPRKEKRE